MEIWLGRDGGEIHRRGGKKKGNRQREKCKKGERRKKRGR
jgi:hypothetical protein